MTSKSKKQTHHQRFPQSLLKTLFQKVFFLLYNHFAIFYDLVAWMVSNGLWSSWIQLSKKYIIGNRILELGSGPGHLLKHLSDHGLYAIGLEISPNMISLAKKNNKTSEFTHLLLGNSRKIPLASNTIDTIISTFPTEYIFNEDLLAEASRVLNDNGRFIIIPSAKTKSFSIINIFQSVRGGTSHPDKNPFLMDFVHKLENIGFYVRMFVEETTNSSILVILAENSNIKNL